MASRFDEEAGWEDDDEEGEGSEGEASSESKSEDEAGRNQRQLASPSRRRAVAGGARSQTDDDEDDDSSDNSSQDDASDASTDSRRRSLSTISSVESTSSAEENTTAATDDDEDNDDDDDDADDETATNQEKVDAASLANLEPLPPSVSFMARMVMCAISLVLLWITALSLANYIASSVVGAPSFQPVVDTWTAAFSVADIQSTLHSACVDQVASVCDRQLNASVAQAESDWLAKQASRAQALLAIADTSTLCQQQATSVLQGINTWMASGASLRYQESTCSSTEIDSLRTLLNDRQVNKEGVASLNSNYVATTDDIFQQTTTQVALVQDYNQAYVANQTESVRRHLDRLVEELQQMGDPTAIVSAIEQELSGLKQVADMVNVCTTGTGQTNSLCPSGTLPDAYAVLQAQLQANYLEIRSQGQAVVRDVVLYGSQVSSKFGEVQRFFNLLYPVADALSSLNINVLSMPKLDVPNLVPNAAFVTALAGAVKLQPIATFFGAKFDQLGTALDSEYRTVADSVERAASQALTNISVGMLGSINMPDLFGDYHPPAVDADLSALRAQLQASSAAFQTAAQEKLDELLQVASSVSDQVSSLYNQSTTTLDSLNTTGLPSSFTLPSLPTSAFHLDVVSFAGSFSFGAIFVGLLSAMGGVFVVGDYLYRSTATVRTVYAYTQTPTEMLPIVDARTQESKQQQEQAQAQSNSTLGKIAHLLTHPGVLLLAGGILAAWLLGLFLAVYIPFYQSYEDGCVARAADSNGQATAASSSTASSASIASTSASFNTSTNFTSSTSTGSGSASTSTSAPQLADTFLSTNSYALMYNYAMIRGTTTGLYKSAKYESARALACGRWEARATRASTDDTIQVLQDLAQQQQASSHLNLIAKCLASVDLPATVVVPPSLPPLSALTSDLLQTCQVNASAALTSVNGGAGQADGGTSATVASFFDPTTGTFSASAAQAAVTSAASSPSSSSSIYSAFNCTFLPECDIASSCVGPSSSAIKSSTHDSSCRTEYTLHQSVFYFALSTVIFLCLNLSRACAMKAMVRIGWRALNTKGITFVATCDHQGNVVQQNQEGEAEEENEARKKKQLKKKKKKQQKRRMRKRLRKENGESDGSSSLSSSDASESFSDDDDDDDDVAVHKKKKSFVGGSAGAAAAVSQAALRQHIVAYENSATTYLVCTLVAHVPYLLLLFVLKDPFGLGSSLKIREPTPYDSTA